MGIRSMRWDDWIEIDHELPKYHLIRSERIRTRGDKVVKTLPPRPGVAGGSSAAVELVYELSEFLVRKYPQIYKVTRRKAQTEDFGWYGDGQIESITILPLQVTYELDKEDPLRVATLLTQEDLALMIEGSDGKYYFQAGAITVPGFWRMEDKIGLPLEEIHLTGDVPQYREKLQNSLERFFFKLSVNKPVLRNNYSFQIVRDANDPQRTISNDPDELAWSDTTIGHEDYYDQKGRGPFSDAQQTGKVEFRPPGSAENIRLRTERQGLRRLPRSGAIVFTIRTYIFPITDLAKEPGVPGRMASAIRSWPADVSRYKAKRLYDDVILSYLDESHRKQIEAGVVRADDHSSNYPY
ncbi:hypothetical protein BD410DRAFT_41554 [Rickenella mellea]|uniref:Uncharacterized protein n=1 Tax=Rickenella mellea TaxID=50990 RepID=A0A4R5XF68_9AGAM|nr:hypothetical protein BD410DRAFT_41554 [Rickenella mellea]